jgi:hypothetical protein
MRSKPSNWKSLKTGNEFPYDEYCNHGNGTIKSGFVDIGNGREWRSFKDLPKDEYPYTIIYLKT